MAIILKLVLFGFVLSMCLIGNTFATAILYSTIIIFTVLDVLSLILVDKVIRDLFSKGVYSLTISNTYTAICDIIVIFILVNFGLPYLAMIHLLGACSRQIVYNKMEITVDALNPIKDHFKNKIEGNED